MLEVVFFCTGLKCSNISRWGESELEKLIKSKDVCLIKSPTPIILWSVIKKKFQGVFYDYAVSSQNQKPVIS